MMTFLKKYFQISLYDYVISHERDNVTVQSLCLWLLETIYHDIMGISHENFKTLV